MQTETLRQRRELATLHRTPEEVQADYRQFRGKCRELCQAELVKDPTLTLVRGHYFCPQWGEQAHWWLTRPDGTILDPTARQFPSNGAGFYAPFDGMVACSECGKEMREEEASFEGNYAFCSVVCHMRFVGLGDYV